MRLNPAQRAGIKIVECLPWYPRRYVLCWSANSTLAPALRQLGQKALWLILFIVCWTACVCAQSIPVNESFRGPALNSSTCDSHLFDSHRSDGLSDCQVFSLDKLPGTNVGIGSRWTGTFHLPASNVSLLAQNSGDSPGGQSNIPSKKQSSPSKKESSPNINSSPGHIFWVVPAYKVDYGKGFEPLTTKEKFTEWARGAYDPLGLGAVAVEAATLEHSSKDGFCGYGGGWGGYGKCFGSLELDSNLSSFIGDFALTSLLHQDPRYFRLGRGSFGKRLWYSVSRFFFTYHDSGRTVFYSSALAGTAVAAGISNLYYPRQDRGVGHSLSRVGIDLGNTALYNAAAEFWPDINRKLHRIF